MLVKSEEIIVYLAKFLNKVQRMSNFHDNSNIRKQSLLWFSTFYSSIEYLSSWQ